MLTWHGIDASDRVLEASPAFDPSKATMADVLRKRGLTQGLTKRAQRVLIENWKGKPLGELAELPPEVMMRYWQGCGGCTATDIENWLIKIGVREKSIYLIDEWKRLSKRVKQLEQELAALKNGS
jgi:hypothetical protein